MQELLELANELKAIAVGLDVHESCLLYAAALKIQRRVKYQQLLQKWGQDDWRVQLAKIEL